MKIAISAEGSHLDAKVAHRFGGADYLLIIDPVDDDCEAIPTPAHSGQRGAGVETIMLAVSRGVDVILTGYCSPAICSRLKANGIEIITGIRGSAREALANYKKNSLKEAKGVERQPHEGTGDRKAVFLHVAVSSVRQFVALLPALVGVVFLIGLFDAFVSKELLSSVFSGNMVLDTLWGACFGSIFAGNAINSYVIGGELLKYDISLFAVTAFIVTWVTVGLVQLPAEITALGKRFALLRNGLSFLLALPIAIFTVAIVDFVGRRGF